MPTTVMVICAKVRAGQIVRLGGMLNGSPWSMSARDVIAEIERPDDKRQWDFEACAHGVTAPVRVAAAVMGWRKSLAAEGVDLLSLPACPPEKLDDT
jgi:hypothetical protein